MLFPQISPVIFHFRDFQITYYALVYFLGFLAILFVLLNASKKKEIPLKKEKIYDLIILLIFGTLIGARIFHVLFWNFNHFSSNPADIFKIWQGGFSFHGGLLGAMLAGFLFARKNKISFLRLADILVIPSALILSLGRLANLINQEIIGKTTDFPLCITLQNLLGCRHPVQIYASLGLLALFFFLIYVKNKKPKVGTLFFIFIASISIGRFFLDFFREDLAHLGLSMGQWLSLALAILSGSLLIKKN